jgi:hypothetical protein
MLELIDPLQGMTPGALDEEQGRTGVAGTGVDDAELYGGIGLHLDSNPI